MWFSVKTMSMKFFKKNINIIYGENSVIVRLFWFDKCILWNTFTLVEMQEEGKQWQEILESNPQYRD